MGYAANCNAMRLYADLRMADIASETAKGSLSNATPMRVQTKAYPTGRTIAAEPVFRSSEAYGAFASITTADGLPAGFLRIADDHHCCSTFGSG